MKKDHKLSTYDEDLMEALKDLGDAAATQFKDDLGVIKKEATPFFNDLSDIDKAYHIKISSKKALEMYYNPVNDTYEFISDGHFLAVTFTKPLILDKHIKAGYIYAQFLKARNIKTYGIKAKDLICEDIHAVDIVCQNLNGNHVYTKTLYAKDIILSVLHAESVSYHAACICYHSLRTKELTHRKAHYIEKVLLGEIEYM